MIKFNNTFIIGIDHGYGNLKTANTVTPSGVKIHESEPPFKKFVLEYNGKYICVGENHKFFVDDKTADMDNYYLTLTGSHRNYPLQVSQTATFIWQWGFRLCGIPSSVRALPSISGRMNMWSLRITAKSIISTLTAFLLIRRDIVRFMTSSEIWTE